MKKTHPILRAFWADRWAAAAAVFLGVEILVEIFAGATGRLCETDGPSAHGPR